LDITSASLCSSEKMSVANWGLSAMAPPVFIGLSLPNAATDDRNRYAKAIEGCRAKPIALSGRS
jgi:hypothetical protein